MDKVCDHGAECVVKNDEPVCECPEACPQTSDPVCGSDGHSYGSSCEMRAMSCALQKPIHIQHQGPCGESTHAAASTQEPRSTLKNQKNSEVRTLVSGECWNELQLTILCLLCSVAASHVCPVVNQVKIFPDLLNLIQKV